MEHPVELDAANLRNRRRRSIVNTQDSSADDTPEQTMQPKGSEPQCTERPDNHGLGPNLWNGRVLHQVIWEELVEDVHNKLTAQFEEQLGEALGGLVERAKHREHCLRGFQWHSDYNSTNGLAKAGADSKIPLPAKVFCHRNSVLTELFELSHIRTVYHMFIAILIMFSVNVVLHDLFDEHSDTRIYHVDIVQYTFGGFREVVLFWLKMFTVTLFVPFLGFLTWCTRRSAFSNPKAFDGLMFLCYAVYQLTFIWVPVEFILHHKLPPASTAIVAIEQVRMFMKAHAFIRTSVERYFKVTKAMETVSPHSTTKDNWHPDFSHYLYFLFAPTLIFREAYPRTKVIRWGYVVSNLLQVCGCILLSYHVLLRFCFNEFSQFGQNSSYSVSQFLLTATATSVPGGLVMLLMFFAALHSWMNAFAEMLRFGDRLFYKDWWNSTTFSVWYRTWNIVVHDWLYTYVYKDIQLTSRSPRARGIAMAIVFWLSAAVHEYILTMTFRFFYPVLFVFFTFAGYPFVYIKGTGRSWNVIIWVALFTGWGLLMCLYSMEWYARKNCPPLFNSWLDFIVPQSWFCHRAPVSLS